MTYDKDPVDRWLAEGLSLGSVRPLILAPLVAACCAFSGTAVAHIRLTSPEPWIMEGVLEDPQKSAPCGGEGTHTLTNAVTRFRAGQTITVEWTETIYHPGHYRIAVAEDRAQLVDPTVTVDANRRAVSATIQDPPQAPVLLDGLYPRTAAAGATGTVFRQEVTLPNITCAHCTLQVIQFMAGHAAPNYIYHHCADIELYAEPIDAGARPAPDAGVPSEGGVSPDARPAIDATLPTQDAAIDAGSPGDAAPPADGGTSPPDTGAQGAGDARSTGEGGLGDEEASCSCTTHRPRDREVGLWLASLLLLGWSSSQRHASRRCSIGAASVPVDGSKDGARDSRRT